MRASTIECRFDAKSTRLLQIITCIHGALTLLAVILNRLFESDYLRSTAFVGPLLLAVLLFVWLYARMLHLHMSNEAITYRSLYERFEFRCDEIGRIEWVQDTGYKCMGGVAFVSEHQRHVVPFNGFSDTDVLRIIEFAKQRFSDRPSENWHLVQPIADRRRENLRT